MSSSSARESLRVDPGGGDPLVHDSEGVPCFHDLPEGLIVRLVDDNKVKAVLEGSLQPSTLVQVLHDVLLDVEGGHGGHGALDPLGRVADGGVALKGGQVLAGGDHGVGHPVVVVDVLHLVQAWRRQEHDERHELGAVAELLEGPWARVQHAGQSVVDDGVDRVQLCPVQVTVELAVLEELVPFHRHLHICKKK